jgi:ribosomal protein S12 methylthiotransferase accessory factor YcaO
VDAPDTASVCVDVETKEAAPLLAIAASAVPDAGVEKVFALIVKAETLPVEAPVRSITPVEVSIPNTFSNPFTQF